MRKGDADNVLMMLVLPAAGLGSSLPTFPFIPSPNCQAKGEQMKTNWDPDGPWAASTSPLIHIAGKEGDSAIRLSYSALRAYGVRGPRTKVSVLALFPRELCSPPRGKKEPQCAQLALVSDCLISCFSFSLQPAVRRC